VPVTFVASPTAVMPLPPLMRIKSPTWMPPAALGRGGAGTKEPFGVRLICAPLGPRGKVT
jgi:hypothetical protein